MQGDYDRTDLLWTASEYPGLLDARQKRVPMDMILAHQQFDGGWSMRSFALPEQWGKGNRAAKLRSELEFSFPQSDGHMTGLAIIALRKAGVCLALGIFSTESPDRGPARCEDDPENGGADQ
jgi:squalene-hopene/tetraprenyl-beta-curcumene cyclase